MRYQRQTPRSYLPIPDRLLELNNTAVGAREFEDRFQTLRKEFLHRFADSFRPQVIVDQEDPSLVHSWIEELQRIVGRLIEIYVQVHERKSLVSNRSACSGEKTLMDLNVGEPGKVALHRVNRCGVLSSCEARIQAIGSGQTFERIKEVKRFVPSAFAYEAGRPAAIDPDLGNFAWGVGCGA